MCRIKSVSRVLSNKRLQLSLRWACKWRENEKLNVEALCNITHIHINVFGKSFLTQGLPSWIGQKQNTVTLSGCFLLEAQKKHEVRQWDSGCGWSRLYHWWNRDHSGWKITDSQKIHSPGSTGIKYTGLILHYRQILLIIRCIYTAFHCKAAINYENPIM